MSNEKKYTLIEHNESFIVCHGSGLTWAEAHLLLISEIMECCDKTLKNVKMFELDANEPGFGMKFEYGKDLQTTFYILDDPGNIVTE